MKTIQLCTGRRNQWSTKRSYSGIEVLVDDEYFEEINKTKWHLAKRKNKCYATRHLGGIKIYMHRLIMGAPKGKEVDHIDGNGLNNQKSNLRICDRFQNTQNCIPRKNTTSKYRGVSWGSRENKWKAQISAFNKSHYIGCFSLETKAAEAYNKKAMELFGEFAKLNIIL